VQVTIRLWALTLYYGREQTQDNTSSLMQRHQDDVHSCLVHSRSPEFLDIFSHNRPLSEEEKQLVEYYLKETQDLLLLTATDSERDAEALTIAATLYKSALTQACVRSLPTELLLHIFQSCDPPRWKIHFETLAAVPISNGPWYLSQVSRRWRQICLSSGTLWAEIGFLGIGPRTLTSEDLADSCNMSIHTSEQGRYRLEEGLRRAGSSTPLSVTTKHERIFLAFLPLFTPYFHQIKPLSCVETSAALSQTSISLPSLQSFSFTDRSSYGYTFHLCSLPNVEEISVSFNAFPHTLFPQARAVSDPNRNSPIFKSESLGTSTGGIYWDRLTKLSWVFTSNYSRLSDIETVHFLLDQTPSLLFLHVHGYRMWRLSSRDPNTGILLPPPKVLTHGNLEVLVLNTTLLLDFVRLPKLRTMEVGCKGEDVTYSAKTSVWPYDATEPMTRLTDFLERSECRRLEQLGIEFLLAPVTGKVWAEMLAKRVPWINEGLRKLDVKVLIRYRVHHGTWRVEELVNSFCLRGRSLDHGNALGEPIEEGTDSNRWENEYSSQENLFPSLESLNILLHMQAEDMPSVLQLIPEGLLTMLRSRRRVGLKSRLKNFKLLFWNNYLDGSHGLNLNEDTKRELMEIWRAGSVGGFTEDVMEQYRAMKRDGLHLVVFNGEFKIETFQMSVVLILDSRSVVVANLRPVGVGPQGHSFGRSATSVEKRL
jgi:hypothetical protein